MKISYNFQQIAVFLLLLPFTTLANDKESLFALYCPPDVTVSCNDELWDLSIYGTAYVQTYSGNQNAGQPSVTYDLSTCNTGYIYRTWTVEDYNWNLISCTQTIIVQSSGSFDVSDITWPGELYEVEGCSPKIDPHNLPAEYGYPTYGWQECSMIGVSYSDKVFYISPTCKKVVRKWQVMDWCQYDSNYNTGLWVWYQTIKISSSDVPEPDFPSDVEINSYNCKDALVNLDSVLLDANSCGGDFLITNDSPYAFHDGANITGVYPIGTTKVKVTVYYGCGKKVSKTIDIKVINKKAPHVYCYAEMITALMPIDEDNDGIPEDGMVEIWAKDLDKGSQAACNGGAVSFSFSADVNDMVRVFTCDEVGENLLQMWVTDSKGAQTYCEVKLIVQNNSSSIPDCEPPTLMPEDSISLYGKVANLFNETIKNVEISIEEMNPIVTITESIDTSYELIENIIITSSGTELTVWHYDSIYTTTYDTIISQQYMNKISDINGYFAFDSCMIMGKDYMISADFKDETKRGVDEKDVEILENYLAGGISFASKYITEAADVNLDGYINDVDLTLLRKFVNGDVDQMNDEKSWLFYVINMNTDEESFTFHYLNDIKNILQNVNFIGAKIGDLNADAFTKYEVVIDDLNNSRQLEPSLDISISPNPFLDNLDLTIEANEEKQIKIRLYSTSGTLLKEYQENLFKGNNNVKLELIHDYTGIIYYQILDDRSQLSQGRLIKI
jgi:hypothetical protein